MNLRILYLENSTWEFDYIINDIFKNVDISVEFYTKSNFYSLQNKTELISKCILVTNSVIDSKLLLDFAKNIKPLIIFYLSDECAQQHFITELEKLTKVLYRQYNHNYNYSIEKNIQIPLGYCCHFLENNVSIKKMNERKFNCSFIGEIKSDRIEMINSFKFMKSTNIKPVSNQWNIKKLKYSPAECFNIYNNSIYVICGRGNQSLDCFRIYEAIVAGSIPVIVGNNNEIYKTFYYDGDLLPTIYADSWQNAYEKCNNLLSNIDELQHYQDTLISWWNRQINKIKTNIKKIIQTEYQHI